MEFNAEIAAKMAEYAKIEIKEENKVLHRILSYIREDASRGTRDFYIQYFGAKGICNVYRIFDPFNGEIKEVRVVQQEMDEFLEGMEKNGFKVDRNALIDMFGRKEPRIVISW